MPDLLAELLRDPQHFNLFQAISLLERAAPACAPVGAGAGVDEPVRLAGQADLVFAPSDIASLRPNTRPGPRWTLRTPAMTLAGVHGPLATPFTEHLLAQRSRRNPAGLDFLDIFNGRLLGLWYRARSKRHVALQPGASSPAPKAGERAGAPPLLRTIDALSGLGRDQGECGPSGELAWLRHAGLQNAAPRSMASLLTLLRDRFGVHFGGRQFAGAWHAVGTEERACLRASRARAGGAQVRTTGRTLGGRAWDQAAGLALSTPPLTLAQFAGLMPGGPRFRLLAWLVAHHLQEDFTVTLTLPLAELPMTRLATQAALRPRLGRSAWLSSRDGDSKRYRPARFVLPARTVNLNKRP